MIKYMDVINAISSKIKNKFPEINLISDDVSKGIIRPSFRVSIDNIKEANFMDTCRNRDFVIRIYYFSKKAEKNRVENLDMIDSLSEIFVDDNILKVNEDFKIEIYEETEFDIVDSVVHCYLPISISEDFERVSDKDAMEELEIERI